MSAASVPVPAELRRPHPFVSATRDAAKGRKPDETGRLDVGRRPGVVYLHVSREQVRRALLIAQALIAECERRGWEVKPVEKYVDKVVGPEETATEASDLWSHLLRPVNR